MPSDFLATLSVSISGLTLVGLVVLAITILRRLPRTNGRDKNSEVILRVPDNPIIRLNFTESLDFEKFSYASQQSARSNMKELVQAAASDGTVLTINGLQLLSSGVEMTVSASRQGQMLFEQGKAVFARHAQSGRALPILTDSKTGKFIEQLKEAKMATTLSRLGALSAVVVGAAHFIAGADIAKRLKEIESKLDLLLAFRRIDQVATLERIYTAAKELATRPMEEDECWEMWRLRGELRELRVAWRREFQYHLSLIEDPKEAWWFEKTFTSQKRMDEHIQEKITEGQLQLALIEYSLRLDYLLSVISGTGKEFEGTLASELTELDTVTDLLKNKGSMISGKYDYASVEPMVAAVTEIVQKYRGLLAEPLAASEISAIGPSMPEAPKPVTIGKPPDAYD